MAEEREREIDPTSLFSFFFRARVFVVVSSSAVRVRFERLKFHFSATIPIHRHPDLSFGLLGREHTTKKRTLL